MSNIDIVKSYGDWLGKTDWDYFSTFTYRFDIKQKQNERLMSGLRENLNSSTLSPLIFYVTEYTNYSYNTHNHMLIKGDGVKDRVESYFRDKKLLYGNVVHYPYEKSLGANYYVTKYIGSDKIEWDVIL
tara:strand:+ start:574 stop:960 length:387 start_codon:yes stop_codon:yes gene_type:complete